MYFGGGLWEILALVVLAVVVLGGGGGDSDDENGLVASGEPLYVHR
jgi:hypothetical protein